jgi:hypothetical protein
MEVCSGFVLCNSWFLVGVFRFRILRSAHLRVFRFAFR